MDAENGFGGLPGRETIGAIIDDHARRAPERTAIVNTQIGEISYGLLARHISNIRSAFRNAGIDSAARVGLLLPSGVEAAIATIATCSHATCVPFHPAISRDEFIRELNRFHLDAIVVPEWLETAASNLAENYSGALFAITKAEGTLDQFGVRCIRPSPSPSMNSSDPTGPSEALVLRTSATTGVPKIVPVTHANMVEQADKMARWIGVSAADRTACILPTYYAQGCQTGILIPLMLGGSVAIPEGGKFDRQGQWIGDLAPTWFSAGPTFLLGLLDGLQSRGDTVLRHSLRFVLCASAPLPQQLRESVESELGVPVLEFYGMSEGGMMAANPPPPALRKPGTVGLVPREELVVRDEAGNPAGSGEAGEIFVRGPSVMPGYIVDDGPAREGLYDGWLPTGDIGSIDEDGFLTIRGRLKEMINRGGEKISPLEIERAILFHPEVQEAAAFGVPHPRLGENAALAVVLKPGATATSGDLRNFIRRRLPPFKVPPSIDVVDALPKGNTGKVSRRTLRDLAIQRERPQTPPYETLEIQIAEVWRRLLKADQIGIDDDFFEAGGDSLLAEQMLLEVESIISQKIPMSELSEASTIRGLAAIAIAVSEADGKDELLTKVRDAPGTPFFFCHGDFGGRGFYALTLARLIDPPQPFYLVNPPRHIEEDADLNIESVARLYVPLLLAAWPEGPFRLGGHCNGGLLAFEIANQLIRAGREVERVLLIETISINSRWPLRVANRVIHGLAAVSPSSKFRQRLVHRGMLSIWDAIQESISGPDYNKPIAIARGAIWRFRRPPADDRKPKSQLELREFAYMRAMANYSPAKLNCEVIAIMGDALDPDPYLNPEFMAPDSWKTRATRVREKTVPGDHLECITVEVASLAKSISSLLKSSEPPDVESETYLTEQLNAS